MRLHTLQVSNFRSCYSTRVTLADDVTLLVGENDAGKSNIIDSLRAATSPTSGRQTLYFNRERDASYGKAGDLIEIQRTYTDLTAREDALYAPVLVDAERHLVHTAIYRTDEATPRRSRLSHLAGARKLPDPEPELRERIAHVYLPPLRDVSRALDSADGNRLADVVRAIASDAEIEAFENAANESLGEMAKHPTAGKAVEGVQKHLTSVTRPVRHRHITIQPKQQRMHRLVRALRLHMAAVGLIPTDLAGSGLGYANLLYIATVVLELERASEFDLTLLLVEEPEAHLHPQLQGVLLDYLADQARESRKEPSSGPSGRIQVIATTHSPQLASAVSTSNLVVAVAQPAPKSTPGEEAPGHMQTAVVALSELPLDASARRKVDRYLDATRATLLFARQVVLVEGIAEALLLRSVAEQVVFPESKDKTDKNNRAMREQFRAISVLPIGGVDFVPYLTLLLAGSCPLVDRVVVVTDGDGGAGAQRQADFKTRFAAAVAEKRLEVKVCGTTLEAELYAPPENEALLRNAFAVQHPRSFKKWDAIASKDATPNVRAEQFSHALRQGQLDLGKGDFAQVVAELLRDEQPNEFIVPAYLEEAIRAALIPLEEAPSGDAP